MLMYCSIPVLCDISLTSFSPEKAKFDKVEAKHNSQNETHERKDTELLSPPRAEEKTIQESQTEPASVQSNPASDEKAQFEDPPKLAAIEEAYHEDQNKDQIKLMAVEKAHSEDQAKTQELQKENHSVQDERRNVTTKIDECKVILQ